MASLFISYRRSDTQQIAGRIHERLAGRFAPVEVFLDIDSIPQGVDFHHHIDSSVRRCHLLLALIGERWLEPGVLGTPRIQAADDFVRIEIETAFDAGIPVLPVLIGRAAMPPLHALPPPLAALCRINAAQIDPGRDFDVHMQRMGDTVERLIWVVRRREALEQRLAEWAQRRRQPSGGARMATLGLADDRDSRERLSADDAAFLDAMKALADEDARSGLLLDELVALDKEGDAASAQQLADYRALVFAELERCNGEKQDLQRRIEALQKHGRDRLGDLFGKRP